MAISDLNKDLFCFFFTLRVLPLSRQVPRLWRRLRGLDLLQNAANFFSLWNEKLILKHIVLISVL